MKRTRIQRFVGLALTCLALAGPASLMAVNTFVFSTFDSDLGSLPYATNMWADTGDTNPAPTVWWTNGVGNPGGAMAMNFTFAQGTGLWGWQDYKVVAQPFGFGTNGGDGKGINMGNWDYIEFDFACDTNASVLNTTYSGNRYGQVGVIGAGDPGWGDNSTNGTVINNEGRLGWHQFGPYVPAPATNGWYHVKLPVGGGFGSTNGNTMNRLLFQCAEFPDTNGATSATWLIDNVELTALSIPPKIQYVNAMRGLHLWQSGGQYDRNVFATFQDGTLYYIWAGNGAATYSFTLGSFPSPQTGDTNLSFVMYLVPTAATEADPDWAEGTMLDLGLGVDTNGFATWTFHYKTNSPNSNGDLYTANAQITITNPTPLGKWTLSFDTAGTGVTMTTPSGNSTNFTMGVHTNIPNLYSLFTGSYGTVFFGLFSGSTNQDSIDLEAVVTAASVTGPNLNTASQNWGTTDTTFDPTMWTAVGGLRYYLVPGNNAKWLKWSIPDAGFALQTNGVDLHAPLSWSTNFVLPATYLSYTKRNQLVPAGALPATPKLFFRLSNPGF